MSQPHRSPITTLLIAASPLFGQAPPIDLEAELNALLNTPVESASKRVQSAIESPQAVEVISADQIRASGVFRLVDVLKLATSVQVWDQDPSRVNVSIRGVNPANNPRAVQILLDGTPLYNIMGPPVDLNGVPVPLDAIERVEIVRGPSSSLYGANAQMGVISIVTKRAKQGFAGQLRVAGTDHSGSRGQAFIGYGGDLFSLTASVAARGNGSLEHPQQVIGFPDLKYMTDTSSREQQAFIRPAWTLSKSTFWLAYGYGQTGHFDEVGATQPVYGAPVNTLTPTVTFPDQVIVRQVIQAGWGQTWSPTLKSEVKLHEKLFRTTIDPITGNAFFVSLLRSMDPAYATRRDMYYDRVRELGLQVNWDPSGTLHFVFGADSKRIDAGKNQTIGLQEERQLTATGGFVSVDWTLGTVTLSAGARAANETLGGSSTSPRFSVVWKVMDNSVLRAGYYTSTRSPMVQEKYASIPNIAVSPTIQDASVDLHSEEVETIEVGYRHKWSRWSLDVTVFQATLKKLIALAPTGEIRASKLVLRNQNGTTSLDDKGVEASLVGEVMPGWNLGLNFATANFKDPIYGLDQQADFTPKQTANLWTRFRRGRGFVFGALQHVGSWTAPSSFRTATGSTIILRTDVQSVTHLHGQVGWELDKAISVSLYGLHALKAATDSASAGITNTYLLRFTRREYGVQAAWRF